MAPPATKRRKLGPDQEFEEITVTDYEDDLEAILAQIKEQEDSEALARQLEAEWNDVPSTSTQTPKSLQRTISAEDITISDGDEEDDETMAKRLAREWEEQDGPGRHESPQSVPRSSSSSRLDISAPSKGPPSSKFLLQSETDSAPDQKLLEFRSLFTQDRNCPKCNKPVQPLRGQVIFSASVPPPTLLTLLHAPCRPCKKNYCRGCFTQIHCPISCKGKDDTCAVRNCCAESRAIAIFEALGGLDRLFIQDRTTTDSRVMAAAKKNKGKRSASGSVGPGGTGYGRGNASLGKRKLTVTSTKVDKLASDWDTNIVAGLTTLIALLPEPYAENAQVYDMLPHPSIGHLISLSYLPELLSNLLRNDSVTDWVQRSDAYHAMIILLRRMVDCELTIQCLIQPRWEKLQSCGLEEWMWGDGEITWEMESDKNGKKTSAISRNPPLYDNFRRLNKQCGAFLAGASQMMSDMDTDEDNIEEIVQATSICGDITASGDDIERAMVALERVPSANDFGSGDRLNLDFVGNQNETIKTRNKGKGRDLAVDMEKAYSIACEGLAFEHVDTLSGDGRSGFGSNYANYNFASSLRQTERATRNPKNRLHLVKELAVMVTCLPPGVWVRVDEVRHDAIKIMIAGPEGTPYAGGLFEFDCFMPLEYPNTPPLVHLRTTGGGSVRFNPNLYNCGKVCLSLLGTWPGQPEEQWSPKSTLLQVIVSIQSMIFVDAPYFNEPGVGRANPNQPASIQYNRNIELQTVRWAMVEWLKDEHQGGLWEDVIASHFIIRKDKIRKTIHDWATSNAGMTNYHSGGYGIPMGGPYGYLPQNLHASSGLDLLKEYDKGIARIQEWRNRSLLGFHIE